MAQLFVVIPAAGRGSRMGLSMPKQYLTVHGKTIIEHTLDRFKSLSPKPVIVIPCDLDDPQIAKLDFHDNEQIHLVEGGDERADSVANALDWIVHSRLTDTLDDCWVMVHDAARPAISIDDIEHLIQQCLSTGQGAILAHPVSDTLKRSGDGTLVSHTLDRSTLWRALTPQMFRLEELRTALAWCKAREIEVTDDASAIEHYGSVVRLIHCESANIKLTYAHELPLITYYLDNQ